MAGLSTCGENAVVDRGLEDVRARGAKPEQAGLGKSVSGSAGWTEDGVGTAEKASRRLEAECGQCYTKPSVRARTGRNGGRGSGRIQTQKHASLFFVCLFDKRKL